MKTCFFSFILLTCSCICAQEVAAIPDGVVTQIEKHQSTNGWAKLYYDVLPKVIKQHKYKTIVEIGVALGGNAESILKNTNVTYFGVDPYLYNYDPKDQFSADVARYCSLGGQKSFDYLHEWVKNYKLATYQERCHLIRETSVNASLLFDDNSLDCIFIDGDHRYEAVLQDLAAWYPKLKKGRLILGDDYWMPSVASAVDQFFLSNNRKVFFLTSDSGYKIWAVYK